MSKRMLVIIGWVLVNWLMVQPAGASLYEKGGAHGLGARAMGMAGAYTAVAEDETAIWWNPAGLAMIDTLRLGTSLSTLYDGRIKSMNFSMATPLPAHTAAGMQWVHDTYSQSTEISADSFSLAGSLPFSKDPALKLGAGLKFLFGGISRIDRTYFGMGLDLGARYQIPLANSDQFVVMALKLQDPDTRITWSNDVTETIPQSLTLGSALHWDADTTASIDLEWINSQPALAETRIMRLGLERWFRDVVGLRAGYILDSGRASTFSFGAGFRFSGWDMEYSLLGQVADLGLSHRLTMSYGLPLLAAKPVVVATPMPTPTPQLAPPEIVKIEFSLAALPEVFSPTGTELTDSVVFQLRVLTGNANRIYSWRLHVANTEGKIVREYQGDGLVQEYEWDGLDRNGNLCPDGQYVAQLILYDIVGNALGSAEAGVQVRTKLPDIGLNVSPRQFLIISGRAQNTLRFQISGAEKLGKVLWTLSVENRAGQGFKEFSGLGSVPAILRWNGQLGNGQLMAPGKCTVKLRVVDKAGQERNGRQTFTVVAYDPKAALAVEPRLIKLEEKSFNGVFFTPQVEPLSEMQSWKLEISNVDTKQIVRTLAGQTNLPKRIVWNAKKSDGILVEAGQYFRALLTVSYTGKFTLEADSVTLATDITTNDSGQALALHLTLVSFNEKSSTIPLGDFKKLKQAAETVRRYAKQYRLQIKGFTDNQEAPGKELDLAWDRARKVKEYLSFSCGIPLERIEVVGYGSGLPIAPETSAAGRAKNRRVEVVLIIQK